MSESMKNYSFKTDSNFKHNNFSASEIEVTDRPHQLNKICSFTLYYFNLCVTISLLLDILNCITLYLSSSLLYTYFQIPLTPLHEQRLLPISWKNKLCSSVFWKIKRVSQQLEWCRPKAPSCGCWTRLLAPFSEIPSVFSSSYCVGSHTFSRPIQDLERITV